MSNTRKHILFLPRWYPNKFDEMWGLFVRKHAEAAVQNNDISVLYIEALDSEIKNTEIMEQIEDNIYTLYIYYAKPKNLILYFIKFVQLFIFGFKKINKQQKIDLTHVHILSRMGFLAYLAKLSFGTPYIITEHWSRYLPTVNGFNGKLRIFLTQFISKRARSILPVTMNLESAMKKHGLNNSNYRVVPNVVENIFFDKEFHEKTPSNNKRCIHVSTFEDKSKNISGIIKGIHNILKTRKDFKFIFIGDGMDFKKMKALAEDLNIDDMHIEFKGLLEKEALVEEYIKADFMIINSHYENMPVVINEAFACGLPVLSTDVGGISEHLTVTRGRLMPPNNESEFIKNFNWMLDHCQEYDSYSIRQYAQKHFSYAGIGEILDEIYNNAIDSKFQK